MVLQKQYFNATMIHTYFLEINPLYFTTLVAEITKFP